MRKIVGEYLFNKAKDNPNIVILIGDTGYGMFDKFKKDYPDRFYNLGLNEQSMVSIAAGLSLQGLEPWVYSITPFLIERAYEQIKIDIMMNDVNVKLIGYDDYPNQGLTHQCNYSHSILKPLGLRCHYPISKEELNLCLGKMYNSCKPAFIRLRKL